MLLGNHKQPKLFNLIEELDLKVRLTFLKSVLNHATL